MVKAVPVADEPGKNATAKVIRVIRGVYRPGDMISVHCYSAVEEIGKLFLFSDPDSGPPSFPCLQMEYEMEVRFLAEHPELGSLAFESIDPKTGKEVLNLSDKNPIRSFPEAVSCLQFVSTECRRAAREFLLRNRDPYKYCLHFLAGAAVVALALLMCQRRYRLRHLAGSVLFVGVVASGPYLVRQVEPSPIPPLEQALQELAPALQDNREVFSDTERYQDLFEMLAKISPRTAARHARQQCDIFMAAPDGFVDWIKPHLFPSKRAELLCSLAGSDPGTASALRQALPRLSEQRLVDASYALCYSKAMPARQVLDRIRLSKARQECALGILQAGLKWSGVWSQSAKEPLELVRAETTDPKLLERIDRSLERFKR